MVTCDRESGGFVISVAPVVVLNCADNALIRMEKFTNTKVDVIDALVMTCMLIWQVIFLDAVNMLNVDMKLLHQSESRLFFPFTPVVVVVFW